MPMESRTTATDRQVDAFEERLALRLEVTELRLVAAFERELRTAVTTQARVLITSVLVALFVMSGIILAVTY